MNNGYHKQASQNENSINNIEKLPFTNVVLSGTHFIALTTTKNICIPHHRVLTRTHSVFFFLSRGFYGRKYYIRPSNLHFADKSLNTYAAALI